MNIFLRFFLNNIIYKIASDETTQKESFGLYKNEALKYYIESCLRSKENSDDENVNLLLRKCENSELSDILDLIICYYSKNSDIEKSFELYEICIRHTFL